MAFNIYFKKIFEIKVNTFYRLGKFCLERLNDLSRECDREKHTQDMQPEFLILSYVLLVTEYIL